MLIWIDLANSPHVPFFRALRDEFEARGASVCVTARDFAQTVELARHPIPEAIWPELDAVGYDEDDPEAHRFS